MKASRWLLSVIFTVSLSLSWVAPIPAQAALSACGATISSPVVQVGSTTTFTIHLVNTSSSIIRWVKILGPSDSSFDFMDGSAPGWDPAVSATAATFLNGSLAVGASQDFDVQAIANDNPSTQSWEVQASDASNGSSPTTCTGDTDVSIVNGGSPITISNTQASGIGTNAATISWDTNVAATTQVLYSEDTNYDSSSPLNNTLVLHHVVNLNNLASSTGYHYKVKSTTPADGGVSTSGDNTFLTGTLQPTATATPTPRPSSSAPSPTPSATVPGVTIKAIPTETIPPTVSLETNLRPAFKQPPKISGQARDNDKVARVEYSIDGGKNWLPVDSIRLAGIGKKKTAAHVAFDFTPIILDDGNFKIMARAIDASGNQADTPPLTLVIDRLPPQLGPIVVAYGPETLAPDEHGNIELVAGSDYRFAMSSVGGPVTVVVEARLAGQKSAPNRTFSLTQSADSGLWNGLLSFKTGGTYELIVRSVDGAGNQTSRPIMTALVSPAGRIVDATTKKSLAGAVVTLYYLEPTTRTWQIWDGAPYSQQNPQSTAADGTYSLMMPEGSYYLHVSAPLRHAFVSDIFTVTTPVGIVAPIPLRSMAHLKLGALSLHLPDIIWKSQPLPKSQSALQPATETLLVGETLANFTLPNTTGSQRNSTNYLGRPTVFTVLTTWSPDSQSQLPDLAAAQTAEDVNVVPVFSQEHIKYVATYLATAGYHLDSLIDVDGTLVSPLQVSSLPKHIFVDRTGSIKKVMVGVLSKKELLSQMRGL